MTREIDTPARRKIKCTSGKLASLGRSGNLHLGNKRPPSSEPCNRFACHMECVFIDDWESEVLPYMGLGRGICKYSVGCREKLVVTMAFLFPPILQVVSAVCWINGCPKSAGTLRLGVAFDDCVHIFCLSPVARTDNVNWFRGPRSSVILRLSLKALISHPSTSLLQCRCPWFLSYYHGVTRPCCSCYPWPEHPLLPACS